MEQNLVHVSRGKKGYLKGTGKAWFVLTRKEKKTAKNRAELRRISEAHRAGYNKKSILKYGLSGDYTSQYITDRDYLYLAPYNNAFTKWIDDMLTAQMVLKDSGAHFRKVHFSVFKRNHATHIVKAGSEVEYSVNDILDVLREEKKLELRPSYWESSGKRYVLSMKDESIYVNGNCFSEKKIQELFNSITKNYVVANCVDTSYKLSENSFGERYIKFWFANDVGDAPVILSAEMYYYYPNIVTGKKNKMTALIDLEKGCFTMEGIERSIENWDEIKAHLLKMSASIPQISYFTVNIAITEENLFTFLHFSGAPYLPELAFNDELNDYLVARAKKKAASQKGKLLKIIFEKIKAKLSDKVVEKILRKGIRPYMGKLWLSAVWSDFLHTKDVSLKKKIWAYKRGFVSYHTYQYGLTEENYSNYLSDFDYYWLNRINGSYQGWLNDKTTYRYVMEPFRECLPKYYFSCYRYNNGDPTMHFKPMWDCPKEISACFDGFIELLKREGKLAVKPSAGTHGDGFYCMSCENGVLYVNGEASSEQEIRKLMNERKSFYVVTEYLEMHEFLKAIYPKSVNTIRVMVINRDGHNPEIMQTYMRIGSSTTGFTDNVGYGGICVMVDKETGEISEPQTISKHIYYACPNHPDTGTPIEGYLPNWEILRETVLGMARRVPEIEYMGFDVTITPTGVQVLEINIHQDLHKANTFTPEINNFFREKIAIKKAVYGIK